MDTIERAEYERAKRLFRALPLEGRARIQSWIRESKVTFYNNGRPFHTRIPCPEVRGISSRTMFVLLYIAMDYDQVSSPPHTPPLSPRYPASRM